MGIESIDIQLMMLINDHRNAFGDWFFTAVTWAGSLFVLLPLSILLTGYLFARGKKDAIHLLGLGFGGTVLLTHLLKIVIKRPRPVHFTPLIQMPIDFSFPSAHTSQITAFCLCLMIIVSQNGSIVYNWLLGLISLVLICCVGYSRLYLQVHFTSDVVAGILLPIVWVAVIAFLLRHV
jgi:undecaprenyl-diphosphatase